MEKKVEIRDYSCSQNDKLNNLVVEGDNWSSIVSMLIDITARKCDYYKSDIFYDIKAFVDAIDKNMDYDNLLVFRECGVTTISPDNLLINEETIKSSKYIYELVYDSKLQLQSLIRKTINFNRI